MKRLDLTGQTFGRLTVLELSDKLDSARSRLWKCQCACGNITYTSSTKLTKGWKNPAVVYPVIITRRNRRKSSRLSLIACLTARIYLMAASR